MDIKALQLFQHLAQSLHFTRTAEACFVSPSTLSRTIQRLEETCGSQLFVRDKRTVKLTSAGRKFQVFCGQTLNSWQQLQQELEQDNHILKGELSLFCSVTASFSHLPELLAGFQQQHPMVEIKLNTGDPAKASSQLKQQVTDVAIGILTRDFPKELAFKPIGEEPLVLIMSKDWPENSIQQIDWQQRSVILPQSNLTQGLLNQWFVQQGIQPKVYARVTGNEAIVSMVALGCGVGIVPQAVLDNTRLGDKLRVLRIPDIPPYQLGLCCLKKRLNEPLISALFNTD